VTDRPLRSGYSGFNLTEEDEHAREERAEVEWDEATLAVRDAAHVFEDVLGGRRRREAEVDQERERSRSRFL
jgi:hypothetical protein